LNSISYSQEISLYRTFELNRRRQIYVSREMKRINNDKLDQTQKVSKFRQQEYLNKLKNEMKLDYQRKQRIRRLELQKDIQVAYI
jgi:hypothetical protein